MHRAGIFPTARDLTLRVHFYCITHQTTLVYFGGEDVEGHVATLFNNPDATQTVAAAASFRINWSYLECPESTDVNEDDPEN